MKRWICSQIGAREHFSIPRALHRESRLERLITDLWIRPFGQAIFQRFGAGGRRLAGRWRGELTDARVTSFLFGGLRWASAARRRKSEALYRLFIDQGAWFGRKSAEILRESREASLFFGYDTGFLEAGQAANEFGLPSIVCQIDPGRVEIDLVHEEVEAWPGWECRELQAAPPDEFHERRDAEWAVADRVMCNSDWSRSALIEQGVPAEKIVVVPLCFEPARSDWRRAAKPSDEPLEVLWLGLVILRKGIQYLLEAARQLLSENVKITVVGPIGITETVVKSAPPNVSFIGPKPRNEVAEIYRSADVFVLPTVSDGFAITQLEAMAYGLPVIATPNCGAVVEEAVNGFVVPARDGEKLAERIAQLANDREKLGEMSVAALSRSKDFGIERLSNELSQLEKELCGSG